MHRLLVGHSAHLPPPGWSVSHSAGGATDYAGQSVTTVQMTREYLSISDPTCSAVAGELPVRRSPSSQQAAQAGRLAGLQASKIWF